VPAVAVRHLQRCDPFGMRSRRAPPSGLPLLPELLQRDPFTGLRGLVLAQQVGQFLVPRFRAAVVRKLIEQRRQQGQERRVRAGSDSTGSGTPASGEATFTGMTGSRRSGRGRRVASGAKSSP
jgi:hypothetical protein